MDFRYGSYPRKVIVPELVNGEKINRIDGRQVTKLFKPSNQQTQAAGQMITSKGNQATNTNLYALIIASIPNLYQYPL